MSINLSPERFGIIDPDFRKVNVWTKGTFLQKDSSQRLKVVAGFRDTGGTNTILPVLKELLERSVDIAAVVTEPGEKILRESGLGFSLSPHRNPLWRIDRLTRANAMITSFSGVSSIELALHRRAHRNKAHKIPVFGMEDYPGSYFYNWEKFFQDNPNAKTPNALPDYLFVWNEWAREVNLANPLGLQEDRIIVTGAPAQDQIARMDKVKTRQEVREKLGIDKDELLIGWFGQVEGATVESLQVLLGSLIALDLKNYTLAARLHPYDKTPREIYDDILKPFRYVSASSAIERDANRVIAACDLVVNERSTIALQAAALGVPVISIAIPEINERYGVMVGLRVPVIEDGTSPLVSEIKDMAKVLEQVLFDAHFRRCLDAKMQAWKSDGKAAKRIADKIVELTA